MAITKIARQVSGSKRGGAFLAIESCLDFTAGTMVIGDVARVFSPPRRESERANESDMVQSIEIFLGFKCFGLVHCAGFGC